MPDLADGLGTLVSQVDQASVWLVLLQFQPEDLKFAGCREVSVGLILLHSFQGFSVLQTRHERNLHQRPTRNFKRAMIRPHWRGHDGKCSYW